jgi:hypothetical protein
VTSRKKIIRYTEGEIGPFCVVKNFLPPPEKLVLREDTAKETALRSKATAKPFKRISR